MARNRVVAAAAIVLLPLATAVIPATGAAAAPPAGDPPSDIRHLTRTEVTENGKKVVVPEKFTPRAAQRRAAAETPPVGTVREWYALNDVAGSIYRKNYTLRGVGDKIEVWVADDIAFPAGDCRNAVPGSTEVTDAQVADLIKEFDTNMYPKETAVFSTPPDRDGSNAIAPGDFTGAGDRTVTLVDNVKDDNYFSFPEFPTYTAGFFFSTFNELMDRNIMTIDAFDWLHRTGADPANAPTGDLCTSRPARPRLYEGVFAHEWQHLLQYYADAAEVNWINEGLSDWAQTLVGYVDGTRTVYDKGTDSHLYCYQGFGIVQTPYNTNPRDCGGPQNSLNLWGEGNPNALLADYGIAYQLMLFLADRYGPAFMTRLHNDAELQGLASLDAALEAKGVKDLYQVLHDFQTMTLVDKIIGDKRWGVMLGVPKWRVTSPSVRSTVNLANPQAYNMPGAAPNGADYVQLVRGRDLRSLTFRGDATLPALPLEWTVVTDDADRAGNPVLFSGNESNTDAAAVTSVAVPAANPTLTFLAKYGAEAGYDYGYVTVSTDGGKTYTAIAGNKTVDGPYGPAVNGTTSGFEPHSYDLSAYAGQTVLLGFRYVSDGGVNEGGWKIDDIAVGGTLISDGSSLTPFRSPTQISPVQVANWNLRLVGLDEEYAYGRQIEFDGRNSVTLNRGQLATLAEFPTVVAIVAYDEPTEQVQQYAPYTLTVNGKVMPGGR